MLSLTREARDALSSREAIELPFDLAAFMATGSAGGARGSSSTRNAGKTRGSGGARTDGDAEESVTLKFPKKAARQAQADLDPESLKLLSNLKGMRRGLAEAAAVPPYVIFSDRTLEDLAVKRPERREDLLGIFGIGAVKAERYGEFIMKAIRESDDRTE